MTLLYGLIDYDSSHEDSYTEEQAQAREECIAWETEDIALCTCGDCTCDRCARSLATKHGTHIRICYRCIAVVMRGEREERCV